MAKSRRYSVKLRATSASRLNLPPEGDSGRGRQMDLTRLYIRVSRRLNTSADVEARRDRSGDPLFVIAAVIEAARLRPDWMQAHASSAHDAAGNCLKAM